MIRMSKDYAEFEIFFNVHRRFQTSIVRNRTVELLFFEQYYAINSPVFCTKTLER